MARKEESGARTGDGQVPDAEHCAHPKTDAANRDDGCGGKPGGSRCREHLAKDGSENGCGAAVRAKGCEEGALPDGSGAVRVSVSLFRNWSTPEVLMMGRTLMTGRTLMMGRIFGPTEEALAVS